MAEHDLFFDGLVRSYLEDNPRFLRRDWLAARLDEKLRQPESRFVLLTARPGLGKTVFMAQLARDHPDWLRYFIRRDQRTVLADVSDKSLLLRIGYQLAARQPGLFTEDQLRVSVKQDVGTAEEGARVVGATIDRLTVSPFYKRVVEIEQRVRANRGEVIGLNVEELVVDVRQLSSEDLLYLALTHPARALQRLEPSRQVVILIDALDEIQSHRTADNILAWLANLQDDLPSNIRFVLTSREVGLDTFRRKQESRVIPLTIAETDPLVEDDVRTYVNRLVGEPALAQLLETADDGAAGFAARAIEKTNGNLGYLDALARGIDQAVEETASPDAPTAARGRRTLTALVSVRELPPHLEGLYGFFLGQLRDAVARERVEVTDPATGESYDKPVWPTVYSRLLGVLAVAMEALDLDLLVRLSGIQTDRSWVSHALGRLRQFLDVTGDRYRFYHATVAEFLTGGSGSDLHVDARQWHRRIADHYWSSRDEWSALDSYGLAHLAAHLRHADDAERLYALLTNAWSRAKFIHFGSASSFSADIDLALDCAVERGDLAALFELGLSFANVAKEVPVQALETLVLLGDARQAADFAGLLPTAAERLRAFNRLLPLVFERSGSAEVERLFRNKVLSVSGGHEGSTTEEIQALVAVGEIERAHARARDQAGDAARLALAWLDVARAKTVFGLDPRIPESAETEIKSRIAQLESAHDKAGASSTMLRLMLETGDLVKADAWAEKALNAALESPWSNEAAWVLSAVVQLLDASEDPARIAGHALRLARTLGTNALSILPQTEIVRWLVRSGHDPDAFDLAEHVQTPGSWRAEIIDRDEAVRAREYAGTVLSAIARTLLDELQDPAPAIARMQTHLATRPALREWAEDARLRALLGIDDRGREAPGKELAAVLSELDGRFPGDSARRTSDSRNEEAIRYFLAIALSLARAGQAEEALAVTLATLAKVRELQLRSQTGNALFCEPEAVAVELIARGEPGGAAKIATAIATCPTLDPGWRVATVAQELARHGHSDLARELVGAVLSAVQTADEETVQASVRLLERISAGFAALGSVERCLRAASDVHPELDRFRLLTTIAEDLVVCERQEAARTVVDAALATFLGSLGREVMDDAPPPGPNEGRDEIRWGECHEWDAADWLDSLSRVRHTLVRLGAEPLAHRIVRWMDESSGWISSDDYRTWAQIHVAEALAWAGHTERAVWLSTQTDWDDFESRRMILRTVAVGLAQRGQEEEAERVLSSIEGKASQVEARLQGAADLIRARSSTDRAIAWAKQGLGIIRSAGWRDTDHATAKAVHRLVQALAEQRHMSEVGDVAGWISDPALQAEAWVLISEALQKRGERADAVLYACRALEAAKAIAGPKQRVDALKRIVGVAISVSGVSQSAALLRRAVRITDELVEREAQANLLAQIARVRLLNEEPSLPAIETTSPYLGLEWTCAFAEDVRFIVVPAQEHPATAAGVALWLTAYAGYFESESGFEALARNGLDIVLNTLDGLNDEMLEQLVGAAHSLAGTSSLPMATAAADRFLRIAAAIGSRSRRANGLMSLMSAFAGSGFPAHALEAAVRAQSLATDAESSANFVSRALSAADRLLGSGHSHEAVRLLAIGLEAAKWDRKSLFSAASGICNALVQLDRGEDLWALFEVVDRWVASREP